MKRSALLLAVVLAPLLNPLVAEAEIYQYKDASGKTVISDRPPPGGTAGKTLATGEAPAGNAPAAATPPKTTADRELEFRKRQKEQQEAAEKAKKDAADKAARQEDCGRAQRALQALESGERIATRDDKGEKVFIDDAQRAAEIERARKFVAETCK